jgi:2-haloacid dehalogenase
MSIVAALQPRPAVIAFDAYGTLFDANSAVRRLAPRIGPDAPAFAALWRAKHLEYSWTLSLMGIYRDFWTLAQEALDHALAAMPQVDPALRAELLDAYRTLDAYPEAAATLDRLRAAGFRLCILTNGSPDMIDAALTSSGLAGRLDAVLSVDGVKVFKTSPAAYGLVVDQFRVQPADVALVSSNRWDIAGGAAYGFTGIWVNRTGAAREYPGLEPIATVADLSSVG